MKKCVNGNKHEKEKEGHTSHILSMDGNPVQINDFILVMCDIDDMNIYRDISVCDMI